MRYPVTKQRIEVLGGIWMPYGAPCAQYHDLSPYDLAHIEDPKDRDSVERWVHMNFGDFSSIKDFRADFHIDNEHIVHDWKDPDSEFTYVDCIFPAEDSE